MRSARLNIPFLSISHILLSFLLWAAVRNDCWLFLLLVFSPAIRTASLKERKGFPRAFLLLFAIFSFFLLSGWHFLRKKEKKRKRIKKALGNKRRKWEEIKKRKWWEKCIGKGTKERIFAYFRLASSSLNNSLLSPNPPYFRAPAVPWASFLSIFYPILSFIPGFRSLSYLCIFLFSLSFAIFF